jgi:hypothetical protein
VADAPVAATRNNNRKVVPLHLKRHQLESAVWHDAGDHRSTTHVRILRADRFVNYVVYK